MKFFFHVFFEKIFVFNFQFLFSKLHTFPVLIFAHLPAYYLTLPDLMVLGVKYPAHFPTSPFPFSLP
jgi:hypothetical protein